MGDMAETSAQEKLQVEEARADFLARFPGYKKTSLLDDLRATEYRRLDERGQVYLDYTGGSLYAESQLQKHFELLRSGVLGNPHSANPTSVAMTEHVERTRRPDSGLLQCPRRRLHPGLHAKCLGGAQARGRILSLRAGQPLPAHFRQSQLRKRNSRIRARQRSQQSPTRRW